MEMRQTARNYSFWCCAPWIHSHICLFAWRQMKSDERPTTKHTYLRKVYAEQRQLAGWLANKMLRHIRDRNSYKSKDRIRRSERLMINILSPPPDGKTFDVFFAFRKRKRRRKKKETTRKIAFVHKTTIWEKKPYSIKPKVNAALALVYVFTQKRCVFFAKIKIPAQTS